MAAKNNFFISYTGKDKLWAEWIEWTLREKGYTTEIQSYDFTAGANFIDKINNALINCERYITVFTPAYFTSQWCVGEWTAGIASDPLNKGGKMVPVRVEECKPEGLMAPFVYVDLVGLSEEDAARALLQGINPPGRPTVKPVFVGKTSGAVKSGPAYPTSFPANNLPPRNINFTGREEILEDIYRAFKSGNCTALTGLGGIGKTQIAYEYAYQHSGAYDVIWRINAEGPGALLTGYTEFAHSRGLAANNIFERDIILNSVKDWMTGSGRWLFIFDNAEKYEDLEEYFPGMTEGNILITSRSDVWSNVNKIPVDVFRSKEAIEFLLSSTQLNDRENAAKLANELGYLPLALEQAAAYVLNIKESSFSDYLEMFGKYRLKMFEGDIGKPKDYTKTVCVTWNITLEKIKSEGAKQLLYICSFFSGDGIDKSIFTECADLLPLPLSKDVKSNIEYNAVIFELLRYSLIKYDGKIFSIHRLLQEVIRASLDKKEWLEVCLKITHEKFKYDQQNMDSWVFFTSFLAHALSIAGYTEKENIGLGEAGRIYNDSGVWLKQTAAYSEAMELLIKAQVIFRKVYGEEHQKTSAVYNNIGAVYTDKGEYDEALNWFKKSLEINEKISGIENAETATNYNNIAVIYKNQGEYEKALKLFKKALDIREKVLGTEHSVTATTYNNIADVYKDQGDNEKALEWLGKALVIIENKLGKEHLDTSVAYNNIALVYREQGEYIKALEWFGKALRIRERVLGKEHPVTSVTYNNIALVYHDVGDNEKALEWFSKGLEIREKVLGIDHPDTALIYSNIAGVHYTQGDYEKAFELLFKALKIYIKRKMTGYPDAKDTIKGLQLNYLKAGGRAEDFQKWLIDRMKEE